MIILKFIVTIINSVFTLIFAFMLTSCSNTQMSHFTNTINNLPGHINGHSITLYNEGIQLDRVSNTDATMRDFRQSANLGNIKSMIRMGTAYAIGHGVLINRTRANIGLIRLTSKPRQHTMIKTNKLASRIWDKFRLWKY